MSTHFRGILCPSPEACQVAAKAGGAGPRCAEVDLERICAENDPEHDRNGCCGAPSALRTIHRPALAQSRYMHFGGPSMTAATHARTHLGCLCPGVGRRAGRASARFHCRRFHAQEKSSPPTGQPRHACAPRHFVNARAQWPHVGANRQRRKCSTPCAGIERIGSAPTT